MKPDKVKVAKNKIKSARAAVGLKQKDVADALGIAVDTYRKKESGESPFSDSEKVVVKHLFEMTDEQVNDCFFDGKLLTGR